MRHNSVVVDTTNGLIIFPHFTIHVKNTNIKKIETLQFVLSNDNLISPPMTTEAIITSVDHPSERETTGTVTPWKDSPKQQVGRFLFQCQN